MVEFPVREDIFGRESAASAVIFEQIEWKLLQRRAFPRLRVLVLAMFMVVGDPVFPVAFGNWSISSFVFRVEIT